MNSLTHGLTTARVVFLAGESKSDFEDLRVGFHTAWAPVGLAEIFLVDRMVFLAWTMGRSERVQSELLAGAVYEEEVSRLEAVTKPTFKVPDALKNGLTYLLPAGEHDDVVGQLNEKREALAKLNFAASFKRVSSGENFLGQAMRYAGEVERSFFKTLHTLERMQLQRQGEDVEPPVAVDVNVGTDRVSGGERPPCARCQRESSAPGPESECPSWTSGQEAAGESSPLIGHPDAAAAQPDESALVGDPVPETKPPLVPDAGGPAPASDPSPLEADGGPPRTNDAPSQPPPTVPRNTETKPNPLPPIYNRDRYSFGR